MSQISTIRPEVLPRDHRRIGTGSAIGGSVPAAEDLDFNKYRESLAPTFSKENQASEDFDTILDAMTHQVFLEHGSRVMAQILRYLKERQEDFGRWPSIEAPDRIGYKIIDRLDSV